MKVLLVLDIFSKLGGGVSSVVYKMANALVERGHCVTIFATDDKRDDSYLIDLDTRVTVKYFKTIAKLGGLNFAPGAFFGALLHVRKFEIIHFHSFTSFINIPIFYFSKIYKVPAIIDCHGNLPSTDSTGRKRFFFQIFGRRMFQVCKMFVAETELGKTEYVGLGASSEKVAVQHPGFDVLDYKTLPQPGLFRSNFLIAPEKKIVFFLGRLHKIKGIDFLVEAFSELASKRDDVLLVLAGPDDGFLNSLENQISSLNIKDKVLFTGFMNHQQKMEALVDSDVFVQPSRYEQGVAHTSIEALLCSLPIVATDDNGAAEDLKKMKGGVLVKFGDNRALSDEIEIALNMPETTELTVKNGREYIYENLDLSKTILKFEDMYNAVRSNG